MDKGKPIIHSFPGPIPEVIDPGHVKLFETMMAQAGKTVEVHWYAGDHFFPFPTYPTYDEKLAKIAWSRTAAFLRTTLH